MKRSQMTLAVLALLGGCTLSFPASANAQESKSPEKVIEITVTSKTVDDQETDQTEADEDRPRIQIALLLDTSNSMDGLIDQAKTQLWSIVNNLVETKKDGKVPVVEVALFEYGNDGLPVTEDYLRQVVPLTTDLDKLSEALFSLKTNGGSEYCGAVIDKATQVLNWKDGDGAYKAIFIAGNEPFSQGETDYSVSCSAARSRSIIVNTIHCGSEAAGIDGKWQHGAEVGGGKYMVINSDERVVSVPCPQDPLLLKLNIRLNETYIPYGEEGKAGRLRQLQQDEAQRKLAPSSLSTRIASKANRNLYKNAGWDLVDAIDSEDFDLNKIDKSKLPEALQKLSDADLKKHLNKVQQERKAIQKQIADLAQQRAEFLAEYRKSKMSSAGAGGEAMPSLGEALNDAAVDQAEARGFRKSDK